MDDLIRYIPLLMRGAVVTVMLGLLGLVLATVFGAFGAAGKLSGGALVRALVAAYTTIVRGVPDLVMILLLYFGGQRLLNLLAESVGGEPVELSKFWAGVFAIGFIYGAYLTETFRGAWMTVPKGQAEAAKALGLGRWQGLWTVMLPQVVRFAVSGYANIWQVLIKATAVVSVIGLEDFVGLANDAGKTVRQPFLFFSFVLLGYLFLTFVSTRVFAFVERRTALVGHNAR
jgi:His/Glu/Gln/Arg/opine family amino acid ABC transporter permease subunit